MKVDLIWVGKTSDGYSREGIEEYRKRIEKYTRFSIKEIRQIKKKVSGKELIKLESIEIEKLASAYEQVFLLDENGKQMSSVSFAKHIEKGHLNGVKSMCFIIGGAYGFTDELKKKYPRIGLSNMTFSHQLIRVIFMEQLYRAFTIINNEPYHHS